MALKRSTAHRIYWPGCAVCQYMKKNPQFRKDVMDSTYFNPEGFESLLDVNARYGNPFRPSALYQHMKRHQQKDIIKAEARAEAMDTKLPTRSVFNTGLPNLQIIEGEIGDIQRHEQGLDDFIAEGREKLGRGELQITATSYLQAIKIKADIEKSTKDRKLDAVKAFFSGGSGGAPTKSTG